MAFVLFAASVTTAGLIASFIPGNDAKTHSADRDYHYVPYAGDVFGA
ncbi:MAG: hypothetical protein J6S63_08565 [Atopobiaceae bacterium]|nr:hypothetical protein [Atopobiaceae bacterium]